MSRAPAADRTPYSPLAGGSLAVDCEENQTFLPMEARGMAPIENWHPLGTPFFRS